MKSKPTTTKSEVEVTTAQPHEPKPKVYYEFSLRDKSTLKGEFLRDYPYKGTNYLYLKTEKGKRYVINPKNATRLP